MAKLESTPQKTKSGVDFIIRSATLGDSKEILAYTLNLWGEDDFSVATPRDGLTLEMESDWIETHAKAPAKIILLAIREDRIIGLLNFANGDRLRLAHTGEFGMSVARKFRGDGIGEKLLATMITWARTTGTIEKITLQTHAENQTARDLYRKLGFLEEGLRKSAVKSEHGHYSDLIPMALFL